MKILHTVESYFPSTNGMQEVVQQISERLVRLGHDITVATSYHADRKQNSIHGVHIEQFHICGNAIRGIVGEKKEIQRYTNLLRNSQFNIITNFAAQQWATDLTLPILNKIKAKKVFVPTGFSALYFPQYNEYFTKMKCWMKQYDMNIFLSNNYRDINFARKNDVKKRILIPNGASAEEFLSTEYVDIRKKLGVPFSHFLILLVGAHTGAKGHKEAIEIFGKAHISNATLLIVAHPSCTRCARRCFLTKYIFNVSPKRLVDKKQLIITSLSRKETISAYRQADLFLFPSNIECSPIVLFEAMASKTPFLATDVGNTREIIRWSGSGILLPTTKDKYGYSTADINASTTTLEHIYHHPKKRQMMAINGYHVWRKRFTWDKIAKQYEQIYKHVIS
ncbi:MAG: glycosyltransferase family 4 protein [bacterium]